MYCVLLNVLTILIRSDEQQYLTDARERDLKAAILYVSLYHIHCILRNTTSGVAMGGQPGPGPS